MEEFKNKNIMGQNFPGRVERSLMIAQIKDLVVDSEVVLAGRIIGILDGEGLSSGNNEVILDEKGFLLMDDSGKVVVLSELQVPIGAIVEIHVKITSKAQVSLQGAIKMLAGCEDFFIAPISSPNYKKILIDGRLKENLKKRAGIINDIRRFFEERGFLETDTPVLVKLPGMEPYLDVFKTTFEADFDANQKISESMYLITSPEYAMKKLLVGGMEKIFQITKAFRNKETFSERHNPEFTILEWYRSYASYLEIMDDTEELVKSLWVKYGARGDDGEAKKVVYKGNEVDLMSSWRRIKVIDAFEEFAGIGRDDFLEIEKFRSAVLAKGYKVDNQTSFDDLFFVVFMNEIEPKLGIDKPVILYDYPVSMAALSKRCAEDVRFAERFEVYIGGLELCNAFTELNDPVEQQRRLELERVERSMMTKEQYDVDRTFIEALKFGLPPAGGNALGVDRLIMLILGELDIRNVLFFPHRDL